MVAPIGLASGWTREFQVIEGFVGEKDRHEVNLGHGNCASRCTVIKLAVTRERITLGRVIIGTIVAPELREAAILILGSQDFDQGIAST